MDFSMSSEQSTLRQSVARYCREHYSLQARREILRGAEGFSRQHWAAFAQFGWLGAGLPDDVGGSGSIIEASIILEEFGRVLVIEPYLPCALLAAQVVCLGADPMQRNALLEPMIRGETLLAFAHAERAGGHATSIIETRAQQSTNGEFVLNGIKTLVLNGNRADCLIVSACYGDSSDGLQRVGLFVVEGASLGLRRRNYRTLDGSGAADLMFRDVRIPAKALISGDTNAFEAIERALDMATLGLCFEAIGSMATVIATTADYLKTRRAYGAALITYQALQHRLAEMLVELEMCRSIAYRGLAAYSRDDWRERRRVVSAAKSLVGRCGKFIASHGIQLHGAMGMVDEYIIGQHFKRLTVVETLFGDSDFHLHRRFQS